eukprot:TRINITY_DN51353_c0_g1_i1.p1 TRINITY_DN51353_c0_g1~~TRINITY_DN51353_c0_g1_i1.p1  ORF type:complete len:529 (-),score=89.46 TRINITY_DN51353_c0_g1_i1:197-1783(-)
MLALTWYQHLPLPESVPKEPPVPGSTELSRRLLAAREAGLYCDVVFELPCRDSLVGQSAAASAEVGAHCVVLRRNSSLNLVGGSVGVPQSDAVLTGASQRRIVVPVGVSVEALRTVVSAHYSELEECSVSPHAYVPAASCAASCAVNAGAAAVQGESDGGVNRNAVTLGPRLELASLKKQIPESEWSLLERIFGPLTSCDHWTSLSQAVDTTCFADATLVLDSAGIRVLAHRAVLAGVEDGQFFTGAFRWPADGEGGGVGSGCMSVRIPEGLSHEALLELLRLRYGAMDVKVERVLEVRHFAALFEWTAAKERCEAVMEHLLTSAETIDTESLLAVVSHSTESASMPPRMKVAALAAAVRQWPRLAEIAETSDVADGSLPREMRSELKALHKVRNRDGHVCGSLKEYLHAAQDDLTEWERRLAVDAPKTARSQLEVAWSHWHDLLFEYGHIFDAAAAEKWREKVRIHREALREERVKSRSKTMRLPPGRIWFEASHEWREVPSNAICEGGLEYRFDMSTGRNFARLCS